MNELRKDQHLQHLGGYLKSEYRSDQQRSMDDSASGRSVSENPRLHPQQGHKTLRMWWRLAASGSSRSSLLGEMEPKYGCKMNPSVHWLVLGIAKY